MMRACTSMGRHEFERDMAVRLSWGPVADGPLFGGILLKADVQRRWVMAICSGMQLGAFSSKVENAIQHSYGRLYCMGMDG